MPILKSQGQTETERLLADLCEETFLKLWSYPNPFKSDGKELCDLLVVFDNNIFVFFDRESNKFAKSQADILLTWERWKKEVIDKQISTAIGAEKYLRKGKGGIFLDAALAQPLPFPIDGANAKIFKIVVAHGAKEACEQFSSDNVSGSLAIAYGPGDVFPIPFMLELDKSDPVHIFDSHNLEIIFKNLNTITDFLNYIQEKERAILKYNFLIYCGEEDLLAHYYFNFDPSDKKHQIGVKEGDFQGLYIPEGEWQAFLTKPEYQRKLDADRASQLWDNIIQRTSQNALDGTLLGDGEIFSRNSVIREMAKEPRLFRRFLSEAIIAAIKEHNPPAEQISRKMTYLPSSESGKAYIFLQFWDPDRSDFEAYRQRRTALLQVACGAAKNHFPDLQIVVGIAIDAPQLTNTNCEDFILMHCQNWTEEEAERYRVANEPFKFFRTGSLAVRRKQVVNFPPDRKEAFARKIGRNEPCPCGSGRKYKRCCIG